MKTKIKRILKGIGIGIGSLFLLFIIFGITSDMKEKKEEVPVLEETKEEIVLGTYILEGGLLDELEYMKINLWKSYEDRTLVIGLENGTEVDLLERRVVGDKQFDDGQGGYEYCKVRYENYIGWLDCTWLK